MCRWLTYTGSPIALEKLLYEPENSLIDQSLHARYGEETVNGDGFGIGYYGDGGVPPAVFKDTKPAWGDRNLRELARHVRSPLFMAHVRASSGTAIQQTNCHPFRYGSWLWMHNGAISEFGRLKRDLVLAVAPDLFPVIEGSTDSEVMFFLALTLGLREDPPGAVERMAGLVERTARRHDVDNPLQMSLATSDGECLWSFRYSSDRRSRSLFHSANTQTLRHLHPEVFGSVDVSDDARLVVSEPLRDLPGLWVEVPESTYTVVRPNFFDMHAFSPATP
ncbi:class II glutamine amidotransferase [Microbispora bryophytorum]|uniref:Class II glutamine amidotransferase n=1 Tax=Microbispora bryophytorum TaxID=1460882 RepID=A0A8H9LI51_9ACTN|nr:class II glutamine amidotransferase [Microbispora bryophytorum]MBD3137698.1 class II glutamine amidotransferase [Microbispora bryophytorum]TQS05463.1 class II glutamine amidotransferase [Microbispora bryophytorum]GGO20464.1 class II glutamine amidotransferase [Microbispora bryophytorum]